MVDLKALIEAAKAATPGPWLNDSEMGDVIYALNDYGTNRMFIQVQGGYVVDARSSDHRERTTRDEIAANADFIALANPSTVAAMAEELMAFREAVNGESPRTDDIAAASVLYQCADCVRAEADYSCHRREDVFVIGREVICRDCADSGHAGEQRRTVPDIPAKLKRQRMAISALSKGPAHV